MGYSSLRPEAARENARARAVAAGLAPRPEAGAQSSAPRVPESAAAADPVARRVEVLRHYDVLRIERVAAICCWGRSGSYLLASYLDGHQDVITMPFSLGELIYPFWEK